MLDRFKFWKSRDADVVAYSYHVVPNEPEWSDVTPAFDPHRSVTFEHPDDRFENMDGVEVEDMTKLVAKR